MDPGDIGGGGEDGVEMQDLDEEDFGVSKSSDADAEFDAVVGNIEDIIMEDDFQQLQQSFMEKYYQEFEDTEENKLIYTAIFNEYIELLEKYLEQQLLERIPGFSMSAFIQSLQQHKEEVSGDIFDMLLTFTDFMAFKEMFIDYRAEKEGRGLDFSSDLVVKCLSSSPSKPLASSMALEPTKSD
ncbi:ADP-ribosylation factor-like protein 2-binding protein [Denticeps clupeoides]|uniref:ADP-ribosylation factor-like protein 2-binding protein n=1 Tax=Denticeps clupeoides TaxID=299321 RepID=UPI0010A3A9C2|nr:ADP-ribosylation factor-like protein 2-binding protein [Denticeps clupeoides]